MNNKYTITNLNGNTELATGWDSTQFIQAMGRAQEIANETKKAVRVIGFDSNYRVNPFTK